MGRLGKHTREIVLKDFPIVEKGDEKIKQNNSLELKTGKSHIIKILLDCMKHLITDVNIIFFPDHSVAKKGEEKDKISISVSDTSDCIGIFIELNTNEFEHYFCDKKTIVGINIKDFYKVINSTGKDDILMLYMEKTNYDILFIRTENKNNLEMSITKIKTIDRQQESLSFPDILFDLSITLSSEKLQKICKNFHSMNTTLIDIEIQGSIIKFKTNEGDTSREEIIDTESDISSSFYYCGTYNLKYLFHFIKATPLSNNVTIYIKSNKNVSEDGFLMLEYNVVDVGQLKFILTEN